MSILKLPTEIVLEIATYLDWAKEDICPIKPNVVNLSVTCSQLRQALVRLVFKDVTLRLRWQAGVLVEPSLYKLRLHCPRLAEHIRSVCIRTNFDDDDISPNGPQNLDPFVAPVERANWLDLESDVCPSRETAQSGYRRRAYRAACKLSSREPYADQNPEISAERIIVIATASNTPNKAGLDALTIAMLCVPERTTNVIFVSLRQRDWSNARNSFAARIAAAAMDMLQQNIEDLTFVFNISFRDQRTIPRLDPSTTALPAADDRTIGSELIGTLAPRRLVLAMNETAAGVTYPSMLSNLRFDVWHGLAHTLQTLELRYMRADTAELLQLIRGFDSLQSLMLHSIALRMPRGHNNHEIEPVMWLSFCLDLRKTMQNTRIRLGDLQNSILQQGKLPDCAVAWINDMAIPHGNVIDFAREERLMDDFRSFLPLWAAEVKDDRGVKALKEWDGPLGRNLCDSAMSRRWR